MEVLYGTASACTGHFPSPSWLLQLCQQFIINLQVQYTSIILAFNGLEKTMVRHRYGNNFYNFTAANELVCK